MAPPLASPAVRALLMIDALGPGGAERQARLLLTRMPADRVRFRLACFGGPAEDLDAVSTAGIPIERLRNRPRRIWPLRIHREIDRIVRRERIELVQAFLPTFDILAPLCRLWRPALVAVSSRRNVAEQLSSARSILRRAANGLASAIVANSMAVADSVGRLEGIHPPKVRVIPNGVELPPRVDAAERAAARRRYGLEEADFAVVYAAHFREGKGHRHLPEVIARVAHGFPRARFLLAGDTQSNRAYRRNAERFEEECGRLGVGEGGIRRLGIVSDMRSLYAASDVALSLSDLEGMSNAVMEAMGLETCVVATAAGGVEELIESGRDGLVLPQGDRDRAVEILMRLASDPLERSRLARNGRERIAAEFSVEKMVDAYACLYEELLGR